MWNRADSLQRRFWSKVAIADENGCRLWMASAFRDGYGQLGSRISGRRFTQRAHRVAWELLHGPIPSGLEIDHWRLNEVLLPGEQLRCSRRCVEHLRVVSKRENRLASPRATVVRASMAAHHRNKVACPHGHVYNEKNTYHARRNEPGKEHQAHRMCKTCAVDRTRLRRRRSRSVALSLTVPYLR